MTRMPVVALLFAGALAAHVAAQSGVQVPRTLPPFHPEVARATAKDVTAPIPTQRVEAKYTSQTMREKIQGTVAVEALVDITGEITDARVVQSLADDLDANAITAARAWKFLPGTRNGEAVPVVVTLMMEFRLH